MKTRNINSEILFNLSPTNNITDSFKKFGINEDDNTILVAVIDDNNGEKLRDITQCIDGTRMELNELQICTDIGKIKKVYKIQDTELKQSSLLDAVVCRMATKDAS
ncbi:EKC/KEOPS complex subunit TPRKB-like [Saccoglossus kowalevskii]